MTDTTTDNKMNSGGEDYAITINNISLGWIRGAAAARRVLQQKADELLARSPKIVMRTEDAGLTYIIMHPGAFVTETTHILRANALEELVDPATLPPPAPAVVAPQKPLPRPRQ